MQRRGFIGVLIVMTRLDNARRFRRRAFLGALLAGTPLAAVGDGLWIEPDWLKVSTLRLSKKPRHRFVHFTDLHYKGDRAFAESVVRAINAASPELVFFTGDIVEESHFL